MSNSDSLDCSGNWSDWNCNANTGIRNRTYKIIYEHKNNGLACPSELLESDNCNVDCSGNWNVWNNWSDCSTNTGTRNRIRTYKIIYEHKNNGLACPSELLESDNCNVDCSGNWSNWSDCNAKIGTQIRTYTIINQAKNNGLACPSELLETNICNVDCSGNWSNWSVCNAKIGTQTRTYTILNQAKNNGLACPSELLESKKCESINIFSVISNIIKLFFLYFFNLFKK